MATPAIREVLTGTAYDGSTSTVTITTDGAQVGDLLVLFYGTDYTSSALADHVTPTGTAGTWTRRTAAVARTAQMPILSVWTRPVTVTGTQVTITSAGNDAGVYAHLYALAGADTTSPVTGGLASIVTTPTTTWAAPSVTVNSGDLLLCGWQSQYENVTAPTVPTPAMSDPITTVNNDSAGALRTARQTITAGGASGTRVATGPSDTYAAASIAVKGVGGAVGPEPARMFLAYG